MQINKEKEFSINLKTDVLTYLDASGSGAVIQNEETMVHIKNITSLRNEGKRFID